MNQGVVMSIDRNKAVILTKEGGFKEVRLKKNSDVIVGQEIHNHHLLKRSLPHRKLLMPSFAAAVVVVLFFVLTSGIFQKDAVAAYISLDGNPSIEASVDQHLNIVSVKALNSDASELITHPNSYEHKPLKSFLQDMVKQLNDKGELSNQPDVLVTAAINQHIKNEKVVQHQIDTVVKNVSQSSNIKKEHGKLTYVKTTIDKHRAAEKAGISTGKYLVYLHSVKQDPNLSLSQVKQMSIKDIQAEVKKVATQAKTLSTTRSTAVNAKSSSNKQTQKKNNNQGKHLGQTKQKETTHSAANQQKSQQKSQQTDQHKNQMKNSKSTKDHPTLVTETSISKKKQENNHDNKPNKHNNGNKNKEKTKIFATDHQSNKNNPKQNMDHSNESSQAGKLNHGSLHQFIRQFFYDRNNK